MFLSPLAAKKKIIAEEELHGKATRQTKDVPSLLFVEWQID